MNSPIKPRIVIVDDHPVFRESLIQLIARESEHPFPMEVCGESDNVPDALGIIEREKPDLILLDLTLRGANGLELIKAIKAQGLSTPVLVLSMHDESVYAEKVLRAGAMGYIAKSALPSKVIEALRKVAAGDVYFSENMIAKILHKMSGLPGSGNMRGLESLTDREMEVFRQLGRGRTCRQIAENLGLGVATVATYRTRIKEKLDIKTAAEFCSRAADWLAENG